MKRVLLIKLTSLGDLIHALPALTDASRALSPSIEFDWLVDENFQEIASWHPGVRQIYTTNHRAWRTALKDLQTYKSITKLIKTLRHQEYDLIIDGQGNFKTGLLSFFMKGVKAGYDKDSVREWIASFAYQKCYAISKKGHAIERLRALFARALDYQIPSTPPEFLIDRSKFKRPSFVLPDHYLVFVHNASWVTKLWPEDHWHSLIKKVVADGHQIILPWGNQEEFERAKRLAICRQVVVTPKLSLSEIGYLLSSARACVCVDTGLSHLAAALDVPSITLYGATDSGLIGASGGGQTHFQAKLPCAPCNQKKCSLSPVKAPPPCLASHSPDLVYSTLQRIVRLEGVDRPLQ